MVIDFWNFYKGMAYKCDNCGKGTVHGVKQRHHRGVAGKRWKRRAQQTARLFKPNLQNATVMLAGVPVSLKLCTRCIKRFKKDGLLARQKLSSQIASL